MKPGPWWRAQNSCVDNAKLIKLSDKAHRNWFGLVCVASDHGGILPDLGTISIKLRMSEARCAAAIAEMVAARLFDRLEDGTFVPHQWNEFQFKTDSSDPSNARRQAEHRKKKAAEMRELKALRDNAHSSLRNMPLRNGVTDVTAKRPETETDIKTTSDRVERGSGLPKSLTVSPQLAAALAKKQDAR